MKTRVRVAVRPLSFFLSEDKLLVSLDLCHVGLDTPSAFKLLAWIFFFLPLSNPTQSVDNKVSFKHNHVSQRCREKQMEYSIWAGPVS